MRTYTICGSMRFEKEMQEIAYSLEAKNGWNILQCVYSENIAMSAGELANIVRSHYQKIELSDGIYVVNIGGYIGDSVKEEIEYAKKLRKEIRYHEAV